MTVIDGIEADNLLWTNRHSIQRVASTMKRALNGAPHVQQTAIVAGHSLHFGTKNGWLNALTFNELKAHSESTMTPFTLVNGSESISVIWDHTAGPAAVGDDLFDHVTGDDNVANVTLKFLTV